VRKNTFPPFENFEKKKLAFLVQVPVLREKGERRRKGTGQATEEREREWKGVDDEQGR
jgi:stalled ribosome alternative rescue factor ArfA